MFRRILATTTCVTALSGFAGGASAQDISDDVIRIGVLTDMSSLYSDSTGQGSVVAAEMAVEDFGGTVLGKKIEVVSADHQFKADVASLTARRWFEDEGVDVIIDLAGSSTAEAAKEVGREVKGITIITAAGSSALSNEGCSPYSVHWNYDTYSNANAIVPVMIEDGFDKWFYITVDYSFGHQLEQDLTDAVAKYGGTSVGSVRHPPNVSDATSFALQAQSSGANIVGLANTGADALNTMKALNEMGVLASGVTVEATVGDSNIYHSLGLDVSQGTKTVIAAYWDLNDETEAMSRRFMEREGSPPMQTHLGNYTAVQHYLKAVEAAGTDDADAVMVKMKELPINNMLWKEGRIREDGRAIHEMFVWEAKTPAESTEEWDVLKLIGTVPGDQAFRPLSESACPLVKK